MASAAPWNRGEERRVKTEWRTSVVENGVRRRGERTAGKRFSSDALHGDGALWHAAFDLVVRTGKVFEP